MRIVVVSGAGLIGSRIVQLLNDCGHETIAASRGTGVDSLTGKASPRR